MDLKIIIPIILTAISVTVTITLWIKGRSRKSLSYDIISSTSLFEQHEVSKFKIFFEDKEIKENVILVLLRIINTGNVPIEEKDFSEDITIKTKSGNILIVEVKETTPKNLRVNINKVEEGYIDISPLLINSKEEMIIKLLIKSSEENPFTMNDLTVESRIVGVSNVAKVITKSNKEGLVLITSTVTLAVGIFGGIQFIRELVRGVHSTNTSLIMNTLAIASVSIISAIVTLVTVLATKSEKSSQ